MNKIEFEKEAESEGYGRVQSQSGSRKAETERFLQEDGGKRQKKTEGIGSKAEGSERFHSGDEKVLR